MKIGFEAQRIFRSHKHGMDFVALELIKALMKLDKTNDYIIYVNEGDDICLKETDNFKIKVFGGSYPLWEQRNLPKMISKDKIDLLHCTANTSPIFCPIPVVVTLHDVIYLEKNPLFAKGYTTYQRFGNVYRRLVVNRAIPKVDKVLTVSQYEVGNILKFFPSIEKKLEVVYNGVGTHFQKIEDNTILNSIADKYQLPEKFVLFLGNTDPKKNTANTLEAFGHFINQKGVGLKMVVGDINPDYVKSLLAEKNMEHVFEHIHFTGYIKNTDLPAVINLADAFLYPSNRESFGIPVIEAMACGTPVITSNVTSMPEVAGDAALLVDPKNPLDIAEKLIQLTKDNALRNELILKGFEQSKKFNWEKSALQLMGIYDALKKKIN
ncbi:MAG: glycosyltransferase family 1 protein [Cytophagales bacterium]